MAIDPQFEKGYSPLIADEGSFVPLNLSTLTEYPSSGEGKFARLVYVMGNLDSSASGLPYGADNYVNTYIGSTNNINTTVYKLGAAVLKTRTYTYVGAGAADNDKILTVTDS